MTSTDSAGTALRMCDAQQYSSSSGTICATVALLQPVHSLVLARDLAQGLDVGEIQIPAPFPIDIVALPERATSMKSKKSPPGGCWGSARRSPGCILEPMAYRLKGLGAWRGGLLCSFQNNSSCLCTAHTHTNAHTHTHTHRHRGARAHTLRAGHTRSHTCGIPCVFVQFLWKINAGHGSEREAGFVDGLYARNQKQSYSRIWKETILKSHLKSHPHVRSRSKPSRCLGGAPSHVVRCVARKLGALQASSHAYVVTSTGAAGSLLDELVLQLRSRRILRTHRHSFMQSFLAPGEYPNLYISRCTRLSVTLPYPDAPDQAGWDKMLRKMSQIIDMSQNR